MSIICPTVTAYGLDEYTRQTRIAASLADHIHIDLMDGIFAPTRSPEVVDIWLPHTALCDIHLMYQKPMDQLDSLIKLRPNMVIIHAEAEVDHMYFVAELHKVGINAGLALLADTQIKDVEDIIHSFDHVLVFSGSLGHHGGRADLELLDKVNEISQEAPEAEIGWDGGINDNNAKQLEEAGVSVRNGGGFIQKSKDPEKAYEKLRANLQF